jgi:hypothetical protein
VVVTVPFDVLIDQLAENGLHPGTRPASAVGSRLAGSAAPGFATAGSATLDSPGTAAGFTSADGGTTAADTDVFAARATGAAGVGASAASTPAADPNAADPNAADPGAAHPCAADPCAADPCAAHLGAADPNAVDPRAAHLGAADLGADGSGIGLPRAETGVGWLDTGVPISAAEARRIACDARIIPAVLGSDSQVLDLGRSRRLFSGAVRRALVLRDRGCSFPMCDRPARWSEGHHIRAWPNGGLTEPDNGCLVCRFHHRLLHDGSGWQVRIATDGLPEYLPPATIDPERRPRRNTYHPRL